MKYKFDATLNDDEYLCFRKFVSIHYGRKARILARITLCLFVFVILLFFFKAEGFTPPSIILGSVLVLWTVVWQIILKRYTFWRLKKSIESQKKKGKRLYSTWSVMEFYDDFFTDTAEDVKYEVKYANVESVSVVENKMILLHGDNGVVFMLPVRVFETKELFDDFMSFIKTKCSKIEVYDKI